MLKGYLFENGLGLRLSGDVSDLTALHCTIRKVVSVIVDYELRDTAVSNLLIDFLEKIERAYSGTEFTEQLILQNKECTHYGFGCSWMELLMVNGLLRSLADYVVMDELDDINLLVLEYLIRKAVLETDKQEVSLIQHYIGKRLVCLNIRSFLADLNFNNADFNGTSDRDSLKRIQEYLAPYFESSKQHN